MKGYTINVEDFDLDKRKRVQDAFFKLGITWVQEGYQFLDKKVLTYGNVDERGEVWDCLIWSISLKETPYEITYDQLMEEAYGDTPEASEDIPLSSKIHTVAEGYSLDYWYCGKSKDFGITYKGTGYLIDNSIKLDKLKQLIELDKELLGE